MSKYLWHSKSSAETGEWLARQLGITSFGTLPPKKFSGEIICWGAIPSDKFAWDSRNIRAIFNDPREVRDWLDREDLFNRLESAGIGAIGCTPLAEEAQYPNICNLLGAPEEEGFVACRMSGAKARPVTNQADLQAAIGDGCNRAVESGFLSNEAIRVFVVSGNAVGALRKAPGSSEEFFQKAEEEIREVATGVAPTACMSLLRAAVSKGIFSPAKGYWTAYDSAPQDVLNCAVAAANALEVSFCAVDIVNVNGECVISNIVTTPNLRDAKSVQKPVVDAISTWLREHSMTSKQILQNFAEEVNEDEAASILKLLKGKSERLRKQGARAARSA